MDKTFRIIEEALETAESPIILSSFSKDSILLTWLVRRVDPNVPILWFRDKVNSFAEKIIKDWNLTVFGYAPSDRYLIPNEDSLMLVDEYSVGASKLPVLRDVTQGERCDLEALPSKRTPIFNYPWDTTLWGFKAQDACEHFVTRNTVFPQEISLGRTRLVAPLIHWGDEQVLQAIEDFEIPFESQDDSVQMCGDCKEQLGTWNGAASLSLFRKRFGFEVH